MRMAASKERIKVYACLSLREEINYLAPGSYEIEYFDFGYHRHPGRLPPILQGYLEKDRGYDAILLGYGLCSKAVRGLKAVHQTLVIPRVHDCIALLLGSQRLYQEMFSQNPGIYFLTRGWLAEGVEPYEEYREWCEEYGAETARWLKKEMYDHYNKLCLIDTKKVSSAPYYPAALRAAKFLGTDFLVQKGSLRLLRKLLFGPWDEEFLLLQPGEVVQ